MSTLNLVPWRERQRQAVMGRWQLGVLLSGLATAAAVHLVDQGLADINKAHEERIASLQTQQKALQMQLQEAPLWQERERQAKHIQQAWPRWQQLQWQAWQALMQLLRVPPQGLQLMQAEWHDGQWRLQVRALHAAQVQQWLVALQAQGVPLTLQSSSVSAVLWRCPQGRLWRLHSFELSTPTQRDHP